MAHEPLLFALRQAVRSLRKQPGFSAVAVLTLALGIGANTAAFSVLNAAVLHPLPYPDPEQLLMLRDLQAIPEANVSFPEFVDWRARSGDIADVGAVFNSTVTVRGNPQVVMVQRVSIGAFAVIAVILAAIGVYGVASYSTQQRTTEIGLRIALGAQSANVIALIIRNNVLVTAIGIGMGLIACISVRKMIEAYLFAVTSTDVQTVLMASAMLAAVALISSYVPIRRALRMSPISALQSEPR